MHPRVGLPRGAARMLALAGVVAAFAVCVVAQAALRAAFEAHRQHLRDAFEPAARTRTLERGRCDGERLVRL